MKYLSWLIFLAVITFFVWPYIHLYQINDAVVNDDDVAFKKLVDIETVRQIHKENLEWKMKQLGPQDNAFSDAMRKGANILGGTAVDVMINANWIADRLRQINPIWDKVTFAFFESPTRFTIRVGQLGHNPTHVQMTLQDWHWRVTAIYD